MSYRWVDHTAELELEIEASTEEAVFAEALRALAELLLDEDPPHPGAMVSFTVSLAGADRALLLADWLDELVFRAETEDLVPRELERLELGEDGLRATVLAVRASSRPLVKGVTHHRLAFERCGVGGGFRASLVLDV